MFAINKQQAKAVRLIFELFASGMSRYDVRDELFRRDIVTSCQPKQNAACGHKTLLRGWLERPQEEWLRVDVPTIITSELFNKVQLELARNERTGSQNNKITRYLLSGVIECVCGFARTGDPAKDSLYYRCTDRLNNACGLRQCYERGINAPVLDNLVWSNVKDLLTQPELVFEQAKRWQAGASPLQLRLVAMEERLKKIG